MLILVDPDIEVESGKMVVVRTPGAESAMFRQLIEDSGQRYLKPLNPTYPKVLFDEGCRAFLASWCRRPSSDAQFPNIH